MSFAEKWKQEALSHDELKRLLSYDPETGVFTWNVDRTRGVKAGDIAGSVGPNKYLNLSLNGVRYMAQRVAWFYVHQEWPVMMDHINRNKLDNRLCNLRPATAQQNAQNRSKNSLNSTGFKGVTFHKRDGRYQAAITTNGKVCYLGYFTSAESAHAAYVSAALSVQTHSPFAQG